MENITKVTLLVGGSIAAYKSPELVRELTKNHVSVNVVMSRAAEQFVTLLTMQTLSGNSVRTDLFDLDGEQRIGHIALADDADVVLVAPATANIIAKAASGIADDALTSVLLATKSPIVFAPAMNVNMWENSITQRNVSMLKEAGCRFIEPEDGELACGWIGAGRLPDTNVIIDELGVVVNSQVFEGSRVLVTAGATREWLDPIRFITNRSTGKMGYAVARAAKNRGGDVTLISARTRLPVSRGVNFKEVSSADEMREEIFEQLLNQDLSEKNYGTVYVFMVAAVADHRPSAVSEIKLKHDKSQNYNIEMVPNPDILQELGDRREEIEKHLGARLVLVGFAAETGDEEELLFWAREKLNKKNVDMIVGNFAFDSFEKDTNRVWILDRTGRQEEHTTADKDLIAGKIIHAVLRV